MKFFLKTYSFFNRFVEKRENRSTGVYEYGLDDLLPNTNLRLINDCGVAKRCVRKKARYIQGDGFASEEWAKFQVNPRQTADKLLRQISSYAAYNEGFALQIRRNVEGAITEVKSIPFHCVRKKTDGSLEYNPTKGDRSYYSSDKATIHPAFFGRTATKDQLTLITQAYIKDDKGKKVKNPFFNNPEILYVYEETADNPHYPVPDYNAGIEDIKTCIEISLMDLELSVNGFMPSAILVTEEIDTVNKDTETGKTPYEDLQDELDNFTGKKKDKTGRSGRFKLMHIMSSVAEKVKLEKFDAKSILEASNSKRDVISREVCGLFGIHPIMAGFSDAAILGNQQALNNVIVSLNADINPVQRMITETFELLYPKGDWTISQHNPITYIPDQVWDTLTDDEKRELIGMEPKPKTELITPEVTQPTNGLNGSSN